MRAPYSQRKSATLRVHSRLRCDQDAEVKFCLLVSCDMRPFNYTALLDLDIEYAIQYGT